MENKIKIFQSGGWKDYELLDTGGGEKLERVGQYIFARPYEDAVWGKDKKIKEWGKIDGKFLSSKQGAKAGWQINNKDVLGKASHIKWEMDYKGIKFWAYPTPFRHLAFFPEQAVHWDFIEEQIKSAILARTVLAKARPIKFLNLFGYTGVASLFALRAGAEVTHLDASKQTLNWAKENQNLNADLIDAPMRIIEDDAIKFLEREEKRGNKYDAIIMDPPKFGHGPKGEIWKIEEMLPKLLAQMKKVLSDKPLFLIITSYAIDSSSLSLGYALSETMKSFEGVVEQGELCITEKSNGRLIPLANTAVWFKR